jgi:SHS2 domain-containing protein
LIPSRDNELMQRYDVETTGQLVAYGATLPDLFEHAAYGMFDYLFQLEGRTPERDVPVIAIGDSPEELLIDWLTQVLVAAQEHQLLPTYFVVDRLETGGVQGALAGVRGGWREVEFSLDETGVVSVPDGWWVRIRCRAK